MTRIYSVIEGRDGDVLRQMLPFYARPPGPIVDVTCNRRRMWNGLPTEGVVFCDIDPSVGPDVVCDFRQLPMPDGSVSLIVFDPPHLPSAAGTEKSLPQFVRDYGLANSIQGVNVSSCFAPFLREARRVLKDDGLVFCKLSDFVHNHRYQWALVDFVCAVRSVEGLTATDLIIKRDPSAGNLKSGRWVAAHHARRSHCWWIVVRKGKCEPRPLTMEDWSCSESNNPTPSSTAWSS